MAKETKVGLLAGLAFIICFAVILTNRGREDLFTPAPVEAQPAVAAETQPRPADRPDLVRPTTRQHRPSSGSLRQARGPRNLNERPSQPEVHQPDHATAATSLSAGVPESEGTTQPDREAMERLAAWQQQVEQRLNDLSREMDEDQQPRLASKHATQLAAREPARDSVVNQSPTSRPEPVRLRDPAPRAGLKPKAQTYEVAGGDTLTKIAARFYGTSGRTVINAIYDANRSIMSSPDDLRAGVELELPVVQGLASSDADRKETERTSPPRKAEHKTPERSSPPSTPQDFTWYQIQKNDRYMVIARRELGDASRWREIYELNKDKFPDAGRIRAGVRIKLPLADARRRGESP